MLKRFSTLVKENSLLHPSNTLQLNILIHSLWNDLEIIDGELKKNIRIKYVKDDCIFLTASSSLYAQEVQLRNLEILDKINNAINGKVNITFTRLIIHIASI